MSTKSGDATTGCAAYSLKCLAASFRQYFNSGTLILLGVILVFSLAAVLSPSWVVEDVEPDRYFGIFFLHPAAAVLNMGCYRSGEDIQTRVNATAGVLIVGIIIWAIFSLVILWKVFSRTWFSKCGLITMYILGGLASVMFATGLIVFDATFNSWYLCGKTYCEVAKYPSCGLDYSWYLVLISVLIAIGATISIYLAHRFSSYRKEIKVLVALASVTCFIMAVDGTAQPHWMQWLEGPEQVRTEWGILYSCRVGGNCTTNTYPPGTFTPRKGCVREYSALGSRYKAVAAFLIISILIIASMFIFFLLKFYDCVKTELTKARKYIAVGCLGLCVLCQFLALVIFYHTMDSWYKCGEHFCYGRRSCGFGLSFMLGISSLVLLSFLFITFLLHTLEAFCFSPYATDDDPFCVDRLDRDEADIQLTAVGVDS